MSNDEIIEPTHYDVKIKDYAKRLRAWKKLTEDIILSYDKLLTMCKQQPGLKAKDCPEKVLDTERTRERVRKDFTSLISGNHKQYMEFKQVYLKFLKEIERIEEEFDELQKTTQNNP